MDAELKSKIKTCRTAAELTKLLSGVDIASLNARHVDQVYRALQKAQEDEDLRLAYLGNYTLDPLPRYAAAKAIAGGMFIRDYTGAYSQYYQEVIEPASGLQQFEPEVIFLSLSMRELAPEIHASFLRLSEQQRRDEIERILQHVDQWVSVARQRTGAVILLANFVRPDINQASIADLALEYGETEFYLELNLGLLRSYRDDRRVYIFDMDQVISRCGRQNAYDPKMYYLARMEWSEGCMPLIAEELMRYLHAVKSNTRKCLVVDLDNTLWGGVIGEEGVSGIKIGSGDPQGEAFQDFQRAIRSLKDRGIVLAICSKNNEADVLEVFEQRKDMPLNVDDFSIKRINWAHKHQNIIEIAQVLNIGRDSLVFLDDNPVECALVRKMLPEVKTIQLPQDPARLAGFFRRLDDFEKLTLTEEDRKKSRQYEQNARRVAHRQEVGDIDTFLTTLGTKIAIGEANSEHIARVHQLFSKTNQFNLTTKRYTLSEVEAFIVDERWSLSIIEVSDNFGDLGIVGLYLVDASDEAAVIDSLILSCRTMGRKIETAIMNQMKQKYLSNGRFNQLEADYYPTKKNSPVAEFYDSQGFSITEQTKDKRKRYRLTRDKAEQLDTPGISLRE